MRRLDAVANPLEHIRAQLRQRGLERLDTIQVTTIHDRAEHRDSQRATKLAGSIVHR